MIKVGQLIYCDNQCLAVQKRIWEECYLYQVLFQQGKPIYQSIIGEAPHYHTYVFLQSNELKILQIAACAAVHSSININFTYVQQQQNLHAVSVTLHTVTDT